MEKSLETGTFEVEGEAKSLSDDYQRAAGGRDAGKFWREPNCSQ